MQLSDKISAVVTGGASGLGAASARRLAERGVKVSIFDLNADEGTRLAAEIGGAFFATDVTDESQVDASFAAARARFGQERVLVNCAGIAIGKRTVRRAKETGQIETHDARSFRKVIEVNLVGTFIVASRSASGMIDLPPVTADGERGLIVMTASVAAEDGQMGQVAYAASKGGVQAMTLPLARDLARDGVRVASILPGLFETPMFDTVPEDARRALEAQVPFPSRLGKPDEYGRLVVEIAENGMLNGCSIRLDGAIRLAPR